MNFLKTKWNNMFGKTEEKKEEKTENYEEVSVPNDILNQIFTLSASLIKQSKAPIDDMTKLKFYGLYKQATQGDCNTPKPAIYDIVGKSKWNAWDSQRGKTKQEAKKLYIIATSQADPSLQQKIQSKLNSEEKQQQNSQNQQNQQKVSNPSGYGAMHKVEQIDYSDNYSHPFFKKIEKNLQIEANQINRQILMQKNNEPAVFPLHFAIDKQRVELVQQFMKHLSKEDIESMQDSEGTGILQYAELIQNQQILKLVQQKLK